MRVNYVIVFVSDMGRSTAFYRDLIGLPLKFQSPEWTEFATAGATLALHSSDGVAAPDADADHLPPGRCRPGLSVPDLDEFHSDMIAKAVTCLQEPTMVFGTRIAQYEDPDGLAVSVAEHREE